MAGLLGNIIGLITDTSGEIKDLEVRLGYFDPDKKDSILLDPQPEVDIEQSSRIIAHNIVNPDANKYNSGGSVIHESMGNSPINMTIRGVLTDASNTLSVLKNNFLHNKRDRLAIELNNNFGLKEKYPVIVSEYRLPYTKGYDMQDYVIKLIVDNDNF